MYKKDMSSPSIANIPHCSKPIFIVCVYEFGGGNAFDDVKEDNKAAGAGWGGE